MLVVLENGEHHCLVIVNMFVFSYLTEYCPKPFFFLFLLCITLEKQWNECFILHELYIYIHCTFTFTILAIQQRFLVWHHFPFPSFEFNIHKRMDSRRNRILIDGISSLPTSTAFNDQLRIMHREWAYRVHKQNDLEMDLQNYILRFPH